MNIDMIDTRAGIPMVKFSFSHEEWKNLDERLQMAFSQKGVISHTRGNKTDVVCMMDASVLGISGGKQ